jgi:hypothetical protein
VLLVLLLPSANPRNHFEVSALCLLLLHPEDTQHARNLQLLLLLLPVVDPSELAPAAAPTAPLKIPGSMAPVDTSKMMARSWSMQSDDYTPR